MQFQIESKSIIIYCKKNENGSFLKIGHYHITSVIEIVFLQIKTICTFFNLMYRFEKSF